MILSNAKKMARMRQTPPGAEIPKYRVMASRRDGLKAMAAPMTPMASVPPTMGMRWAADMIYMDLSSPETNHVRFQEMFLGRSNIPEMPRFGFLKRLASECQT